MIIFVLEILAAALFMFPVYWYVLRPLGNLIDRRAKRSNDPIKDVAQIEVEEARREAERARMEVEAAEEISRLRHQAAEDQARAERLRDEGRRKSH